MNWTRTNAAVLVVAALLSWALGFALIWVVIRWLT